MIEYKSDVERLRAILKHVSGAKAKRRILGRLHEAQGAEKRSREAEALQNTIRGCRECGLNRTRKNAVPFVGPTHGEADLVIVEEAPGDAEDYRGEPFMGNAGRKLDLYLEQAGTYRSKVFMCNTICCRPPKDRDPSRVELEACRPNLQAQLDLADVPVGVTFGAGAYSTITGEPKEDVVLSGVPVWHNNMIWLPTHHPSYVEGHEWAASAIRITLQTALALRMGTVKPPIPPWIQVEVDGHKVSGIDKALEKKGWALVHSSTLDSQIVVIDSEFRDRGPGKLPDAIVHLPQYELKELMAMGMLGKGMGGWSKKQLQTIHMVKHEFGGKVFLDG